MEDVDHVDSIVAPIGRALGTSDNALKLLVSLFAGYPLALIHRHFLYGRRAYIQHVYFIITGLCLCYWNFGWSVLHSVGNLLAVYLLLLTLGGTKLSVAISFLLNMGYLIIAYWYTMSGTYTVKWTTPHCVLTLRLIAVVFDVYDGRKKQEKLSVEQKESALTKSPSLIELFAQTYCFGGLLVGPQFSMKRYLDFVNGAFSDKVIGDRPACVWPALVRMSAGVAYVAVYQIGGIYFPEAYLLSTGFEDLSFLWRIGYIIIWSKLMLYKYLACWLIAEGGCILVGLSYNGKDENGNDLWDGCANLHIRQFELAKSGAELVQSFNTNTNKWMAKYIFKRLRFVGSKDFSQITTLAFLAIWHGLYSGYFMNFFVEFLMMKFEKDIQPFLERNSVIQGLYKNPVTYPFVFMFMKAYNQFVLGYALIGFTLFYYDKYMKVYQLLYFSIHLLFIGAPMVAMVWKSFTRKKKKVPTATLR